jgi:nucleoid-associated protein YgaU
MQQIERYGVIALVFLLVTIVAVSFWGDSKSPGFWSRLTGRGAKKDTNSAQVSNMIPPATSTERAIDPSLPLTTSPGSGFDSYAGAPSSWQPQPAYGPGTALEAPSAAPLTSVPAGNDPWTSAPTAPPEIANRQDPLPSSPVPTTAPRTAPAPAAKGPQYVVQKGDSLIRIASKTLGSGSRWTEIQALNGGLDPRNLHPGMTLSLPAAAKVPKSGSPAAAKPAKRPPSASPSSGTGTYVVRAGDTLSSIASRVLGDGNRWREILSANPGLNPKRLFVGKSLRVPAVQSVRAPELAAAAPRPSRSASSDLPDRPRVR